MTSMNTRQLSGVLVLTFLLGAPARALAYACPQDPPPAKTETYQGFLGRVYVKGDQELPYRLFVPEAYEAGKKYPLVLYLHHAGLAGSDQNNDTGWDNCVQLTSEIGSGNDYGGVFTHQAVDKDGKRFETQERYPHFVLAPHAQSSAYGFGGGVAGSASGAEHATRPLLKGILADVQAEFSIDPARLYVTGVSMGCYGTWDFIMRDPSVFAAASPQSCRGDPDTKLLAGLKDLPVWSMCGTNDSYFAGARAMADGMEQIGASAFTFTAMEGVGHSINDRGYDYPGFIDWMFAQHRTDVPSSGGGGAGGSGAGGAAGATSGGVNGTAGASGGAGGVPSGGATSEGGSAGGAVVAGGSGGAPSAMEGAPSPAAGAPNAGDTAESSSSCSISSPLRARSSLVHLSACVLLASAAWRRNQRRDRRSGGSR
jgi:poly(3-hydroxybutyrate) depolymerase